MEQHYFDWKINTMKYPDFVWSLNSKKPTYRKLER